jgi:hypothetical protein
MYMLFGAGSVDKSEVDKALQVNRPQWYHNQSKEQRSQKIKNLTKDWAKVADLKQNVPLSETERSRFAASQEPYRVANFKRLVDQPHQSGTAAAGVKDNKD